MIGPQPVHNAEWLVDIPLAEHGGQQHLCSMHLQYCKLSANIYFTYEITNAVASS